MQVVGQTLLAVAGEVDQPNVEPHRLREPDRGRVPEPQIPERVDDEPAAAGDEARVAAAEAAIFLQARVDVAGEGTNREGTYRAGRQ